ncbi:MAG: hypothetical protein ACT6FB_01865 [Methanosarcinaceae archaeon]
MKQGLLTILKNIFSSSGYNVTESYRYDMVAEKNGCKTLINIGVLTDHADIKNFSDQVTDGTGLYIATNTITDDFYQYATENGLMVWDRDDVALQIGKAVLADIEGTTADLELLSPVNKPASTQTMNTCFVPDEDKSIFGMFGQSNSNESTPMLETISETMPETQPPLNNGLLTHQEYGQQPPLVPKSPIVLNLHTAPLNITKEQVLSIAKQHIGIVENVALKFVPFWLYRYSINVEQKYKSKIIDISGNGVGCLNALNGNNENIQIDEVHEKVEVPDEIYEVKGPILTRDEANRNLLGIIIDEHTKDIRFDSIVGDTLISEHKLFKPTVGDVNLDIDLIYLPVWELNGKRNSVEINGYNAEVLCNPVDDDVEFI